MAHRIAPCRHGSPCCCASSTTPVPTSRHARPTPFSSSHSCRGWLVCVQRQLVELRVDELIGSIALDRCEAERSVERLCGSHVGQCAKPQRRVAARARAVDQREEQATTNTLPAPLSIHEHALYLRDTFS